MDRNDKKPESRLQEQIAGEAAEWFAKLHETPAAHATQPEREEFSQWLLRSPTHIEEYLAITRVWGDVETLTEISRDDLVQQAIATKGPDNVVSLTAPASYQSSASDNPSPGIGEGGSATRGARLQAKHYALAASLLLAVGASVYFWTEWLYPTRIVTDIGEQRSITLRDGSVVHLNTDSDARFDLSERVRRVTLARGEARFTVARDPNRPFLVSTRQATVGALGTVFNVRTSDQGTSVTVIEGKVALSTPNNARAIGPDHLIPEPRLKSLELKAGQNAAITQQGKIVRDAGPSVETVLAWSERRLVFRDQPLAEVVAEFNRYHKRPIRIEDAALASLRISGTFSASDSQSLVEYLERYENVHTRTDTDGAQYLTR